MLNPLLLLLAVFWEKRGRLFEKVSVSVTAYRDNWVRGPTQKQRVGLGRVNSRVLAIILEEGGLSGRAPSEQEQERSLFHQLPLFEAVSRSCGYA